MCSSYNRSRKLAYLLRHDSEYCYEPGGWRSVFDLIKNYLFTQEEIICLVCSDSKDRFELNDDGKKIRALYGHSVKFEQQLTEFEPPESLYHGSALKYLSSIEDRGLLSKARQFVHLTEDKDTAIKIGQRHGEPILLKIASRLMKTNGYKFYKLNNGVWLSKEIPIEYIELIKL